MSRSGLFRAAALLAASAAPLLAGSASAAELPQLGTGLPDVGADKLVSNATQLAGPLGAVNPVQMPQVDAPVPSELPVAPLPAVPDVQERSVQHPIAVTASDVAGLPNPRDLPGTASLGNLPSPSLSDLPTNGVVPNPSVLSGVHPTING
ncbi:hypothetical protein GCM10011609_36560 [Lentzea pudingi]|uniref:Secreted protein n=1 Tax=Lentzea pudingi TaxID=1789439 RepID=A0ABQ2I1D9_9PSEU|nr:hypothetical protein [Lentzea pudingi]GGM95637.1 hypothetical protein GCM10011609_36560 [Lentzea pudingi]